MEHLGGGEIKWRTTGDQPILTVNQTRRMFRDAILGLEYRKSFPCRFIMVAADATSYNLTCSPSPRHYPP